MNTIRKTIFILLAAAPFASSASAEDNLWVGVKAGTLGIGIEGTWRPIPWLDLRLGADKYDYDDTRAQAGINYDAGLSLDTYHASASFRFPLSPMRLTVGAYVNNNELNMVSQDAPLFDLGDSQFTSADVGQLRSVTYFEGTAPYLGVGFDFDLFNRVGLNLDFGVLWQGDPTVSLEADGLLANDQVFLDALESERQQLEAEVGDYKAWPVISIGFNFNFF
jgi:hypothetical protein